MKMTFGASGNFESAPGSRRSATRVSMPSGAKLSRRRLSENRATATILLRTPALSAALRARLAKLGPIFPPAPRMSKSPASRAIAAASASDGRERISSSLASVSICMLNPVRIRRLHKPFRRSYSSGRQKPCVLSAAVGQIRIPLPAQGNDGLCLTDPNTSLIPAIPATCVLSQDEQLSAPERHTDLNSGSVRHCGRNSKHQLQCQECCALQAPAGEPRDPRRMPQDQSPVKTERTTEWFCRVRNSDYRETSALQFAQF